MKPKLIISGFTGRMGSCVLTDALKQGFDVIGVMDQETFMSMDLPWEKDSNLESLVKKAGIGTLIDFTSPSVTMEYVRSAAKLQIPMVIGTTGFTDEQKKEIEDAAKSTLIFMSPNMSLGINAILAILPKLTSLLGDGYDLEIAEIHHKHKKDAPSGTALRIAETISSARNLDLDLAKRCGRSGITGERENDEIGIHAIRGGDVAGVHTVYFLGEGERIEITHHAHSRENFAKGAIRAAVWLSSQQIGKLYTMQDMVK